MSKDQKKTISIPVETVENFARSINYVTSTLSFWKFNKFWPGNLVYDCLEELYEQVSHFLDVEIIRKKSQSVSRSHINDK